MADLNNLVEQASGEFDQLVEHIMRGENVDHAVLEEAVGPDLVLLLDAAANVKIVYMTQRAQRLAQVPQIGADSFMPSTPNQT